MATKPKAYQRAPRAPRIAVALPADCVAPLRAAGAKAGLSPNAWAAAVICRRLQRRATFPPLQSNRLIDIQIELRRIACNVNEMARAMTLEQAQGRAVQADLAALEDMRRETRSQLVQLRGVLIGALAYWEIEP